MHPIYTLIVVGYVSLLLVLTLAKVKIFKLLGVTLIVSQFFCLYHIFINQPSQVVWLCNVVVFMQFFLLFKFNQKLFDVSFFFAWTGCFLICFMPNNPYAQMLRSAPLFWVTYWVKHIVPLILPIYFFHVKKKKLSRWSIYSAAGFFLVYCASVYLYNLALNQNIFYLMEPASFMKGLGSYYFMIAIVLGYLWFSTLYVIANVLGWVKTKTEESA
ncbi:MAG: hypothetical protein S4CHLAM7_05320 [Chlamydiae bacterium]|nr:hypothetical protein [Chlamydiota bacterium]